MYSSYHAVCLVNTQHNFCCIRNVHKVDPYNQSNNIQMDVAHNLMSLTSNR